MQARCSVISLAALSRAYRDRLNYATRQSVIARLCFCRARVRSDARQSLGGAAICRRVGFKETRLLPRPRPVERLFDRALSLVRAAAGAGLARADHHAGQASVRVRRVFLLAAAPAFIAEPIGRPLTALRRWGYRITPEGRGARGRAILGTLAPCRIA